MFDLFHLDEDVSKQINDTQQSHVDMDFMKIVELDADYADELLKHPDKEIKILSKAASGYANRVVEVALRNVPDKTNIHEVHRDKFYKIIQLKGTVMQRSERTSRPTMLVYKCPACNEETNVEQTEQWRTAPEKCEECDNRKGFTKVYEKTVFDECQWLELQELLGNQHLSDTPAKIRVLVRNQLIDSCTPGETVTVIGIPKAWENRPNTLDLSMKIYIDCKGLINDTDEDTVDLSSEDIEELHILANTKEHLANIIKSFAPTVYGEEVVKEALAYQQCEGVSRQLTRKKRRRGQFHILLAGPPGVAKSDLGEYQTLYHHKGRMATGRGSSSVGLTASVVQENGEWVLKAGAMPLADNGLLFIDEIEKMRSEDSGAMHPGMEAQQIPISKAGINATVKTRCSIIAACNPIGGTWSDYKTLPENLIEKGKGLTIPLLNRFALIFIVREKETEAEEADVVDHILNISLNKEVDIPYSEDVLRKLFLYARTLKPKLSDEAAEKLKQFYLNLFKASKDQEGMIMSRRQIEDLVRISEASAKIHLRDTVTVDDADSAIRVVAASLKQYGIDPLTGNVDQTKVLYGKKASKSQMVKQIPIIIRRISSHNIDKSKVTRVAFIESASSIWSVLSTEAGDVLDVALREGLVYCPTPQTLAVTSTLLNIGEDTEEDDTDE